MPKNKKRRLRIATVALILSFSAGLVLSVRWRARPIIAPPQATVEPTVITTFLLQTPTTQPIEPPTATPAITEEPPATPEIIGPTPIEGRPPLQILTDTAWGGPSVPEGRCSIAFVGDILPHTSVYQAAQTADGYDFTKHFELIGPRLEADYVVANLEVPVTGGPPANFPNFNSPPALLRALRDSLGVKLITRANNHALDQDISGLRQTAKNCDEMGLPHIGANEGDAIRTMIAKINGINVGFIAVTDIMNVPNPKSMPWGVSLAKTDQVTHDIHALRANGAEYIIICVHWGDEYVQPNARQRRLAVEWVEAGADSIIGHHPHVPQPIELLPGGGVVAFSLGNFIASQSTTRGYVDTGLAIRLTLARGEGGVYTESVAYKPTYIDRNLTANHCRVLDIAENLDRAAYDPWLDDNKINRMRSIMAYYETLMAGRPAELY